MNYREKIAETGFLRQTCFEHIYRFEKHESFIKRLETERGLFEGDLSGIYSHSPVSLIVIVDSEPGSDLEQTIISWELQSCPLVRCQLVTSSNISQDILQKWFSERKSDSCIDLDVVSENEIEKICNNEYVVFAKPGDILHPSLATTIMLSSVSQDPDIVVFNYQCISDDGKKPARFNRQPLLDQYALIHGNYIGTCFAVKNEIIKRYPYNILDHILHNGGHLFHIWCSINQELKWVTHPEYFFLKPDINIADNLLDIYTPYKNIYQKQLKTFDSEFEFIEQENSIQAYRLEPKQKASSVTVIVPFRDKVEATCRCLDSVLSQEFDGNLEVILVNNNSSAETSNILSDYIHEQEKVGSEKRQIKIINYHYPFNHSRQCNLGAKESSGEVIVFLNNDAIFKNTDVLKGLSNWALVKGVGTVGGRVTSPEGKIVSAGLRARLNSGFDYNSGIEESTDTVFSESIQEVLGNTFACAAISRAVYDKVGLLNEIEFPNGYNDIEYNLRVKRSAYRNIYLGHLLIEHEPGTSRGRCDEIFQKILIRDRFPELAHISLYQKGGDEHLMQRWKKITLNSKVVERVGKKFNYGWIKGLRNHILRIYRK